MKKWLLLCASVFTLLLFRFQIKISTVAEHTYCAAIGCFKDNLLVTVSPDECETAGIAPIFVSSSVPWLVVVLGLQHELAQIMHDFR